VRRLIALSTLLPAIALAAGCGVERTLRLESDPPGALVYLNGEEIARTPAEVPLEWYGKYDVAVRLEGYETLKDERWVVAPWWQWPPIDLVAELVPLPLRDRRRLSFMLKPEGRLDEGVLDRGEAMRASQSAD
jgi:hypothetical protein